MTVRDIVGQLVMVGFHGTELSQEWIAWLQEYRPGGVILFSRNLVDPEQMARLTNALQEHVPNPPLLIAIDQEGGPVSRLPQGFTRFPSASTIAACKSPDLAYEVGEVTAKELRAVGITMNMAPVLDVNSNPANPIIGNRAYGDCPEHVCSFGTAVMQGLQSKGVIPCGKHFPGHGDTSTDSHNVLPVVHATRERLDAVELKPFHHAIQHGLPTIMTAHVRYPALDTNAPATLSRPIVTDLLRKSLKFHGVILTDDLEMRAIFDHWPVGEAAVRSLQAGADMVLLCHQQERQTEAILAIEQALADGKLSINELTTSLDRITAFKKTYLASLHPVDLSHVSQTVGIAEHKVLLEKVQRVEARV